MDGMASRSSHASQIVLTAARRALAGRSFHMFFAGLALVLAGVTSLGCGPEEANSVQPRSAPAVAVEIVSADPQRITETLDLVGQLEAEGSVMVRAEADGIVEEFLFAEGSAVRKGETLFVLRNQEQKARLRAREAELALEQDEYQRTANLAGKSIASDAQLNRAEAELEIARANVELARVELERTYVRAPFGGLTGDGLVWICDRITETTPLVRLDDVDRLQLFFSIPESAIGLAELGARVEIRVAAYPSEAFEGDVFFVSPSVDRDTRRLLVKAWIPNDAFRLRPGMFADVEIDVGEREDALMVPESAIVYDRVGSFVWRVAQGEVAERVPVDLGVRQAGRVEITQGLSPGDRVVVAGTHKVTVGATLKSPPARAADGADPAGREGES